MSQRRYSPIDLIMIEVDNCVNTILGQAWGTRKNPASHLPEPDLSVEEQKQSIGFMRINHSGEVCAQALYRGQALLARSKKTRDTLLECAAEETDHLAWCQDRIKELRGHRSYLDLYWYLNAFFMGIVAGAIGDQWSLAFVVETEYQVESHLEGHLSRLAPSDNKSRAIVAQMCDDEKRHGQTAKRQGAAELPSGIKRIMTLHAKVMTTLVYWV